MKPTLWMRVMFMLAAVYDGLLGAVFLLVPAWPFEQTGTPPPNHFGYIRFPAAVLIVFALMFAAVAWRPVRYRLFIPPGIGLKLAFCLTAAGYWVAQGIPMMFRPFCVIDAMFAALFVWAWVRLAEQH